MAALRRFLSRSLPISSYLPLTPLSLGRHKPSSHHANQYRAGSSGYSPIATVNLEFALPLAAREKITGLLAMRSQPAFLICHRHMSSSTTDPSSTGNSQGTEGTDRLHQSSKLTFRHIMGSVATAPVVPMTLGVAGAIPFLALTPPFPYLLPLPEALSSMPLEAQAAYGAVILSFLGGPHWGLAMVGINASPNHKVFNFTINSIRYVWSVIPSLLGWSALLMPVIPKFGCLISSFCLVLAIDVLFVTQGLVPLWYLPLRLLLSTIAILCLIASMLETLILQKLESSKQGSKGEA